jgi:fructokinase
MESGEHGLLRLGVDLGGTKMEAVVLRLTGGSFEILTRLRRPTQRGLGYQHIIEALVALLHDTARQAGLASLPPMGIGMPGSISRRSGLTKNSNTTCLNGRPFRADVIAKLGQPVRFANDANCFALAEALRGRLVDIE